MLGRHPLWWIAWVWLLLPSWSGAEIYTLSFPVQLTGPHGTEFCGFAERAMRFSPLPVEELGTPVCEHGTPANCDLATHDVLVYVYEGVELPTQATQFYAAWAQLGVSTANTLGFGYFAPTDPSWRIPGLSRIAAFGATFEFDVDRVGDPVAGLFGGERSTGLFVTYPLGSLANEVIVPGGRTERLRSNCSTNAITLVCAGSVATPPEGCPSQPLRLLRAPVPLAHGWALGGIALGLAGSAIAIRRRSPGRATRIRPPR